MSATCTAWQMLLWDTFICSGALRSVEQEYRTVDEDISGDDKEDTDDKVRVFSKLAVVAFFVELYCCDHVDTHCWWGPRVLC
jgi:hypothetical protein